MLDVRRLRVLKEVAERGSFSAAADALNFTQSAVSQQIAALEKETGTTLLQRGAGGVRLTDAGRALVAHADVILARLADAERELAAIAGLQGGRVRLASFPSAGATLVTEAVSLYRRRHPDVELSLTEGEPHETVPRLKRGDFDVAVVFDYSHSPGGELLEGLDCVHLLDDPLCVVLPADHPLAARKAVRLERPGERAVGGGLRRRRVRRRCSIDACARAELHAARRVRERRPQRAGGPRRHRRRRHAAARALPAHHAARSRGPSGVGLEAVAPASTPRCRRTPTARPRPRR